ncbi:MAG: class I SAM-dependent methyltransferase [Erythrobacter sp.]
MRVLAGLGALALAACDSSVETAVVVDDPSIAAAEDTHLADVLWHDRRKNDRKRDKYRHPVETLAFFQLAPDQTVIEYAPGGGWYTRVLAPYLADDGAYIAVGFAPEGVASLGKDFQTQLREGGEGFAEYQSTELGIPAEKLPFYFSDAIPERLNGTVDTVLIIRMMHNLVRWGIAESEIAALHETLKPGGLLGVVQHRAKPDSDVEFTDGNAGYLKQADIIALFESNGFELIGSSEINANSKDPTDHEAGVWTLPPSFALGDKDKDRYKEIGESDRMTLLFRKTD